MGRHPAMFVADNLQSDDSAVWCELYNSLRPYILACVYTSKVSCWHGQEQDIAEDVVQETIIRTMKYARQAKAGYTPPIYSLMCFGRTVAYNHIRDLRRRDLRLIRPEFSDQQIADDSSQFVKAVDPSEIALKELTHYTLWKSVALVIAKFPEKQRDALLIDLAMRADFQDGHSSLWSAFLSVGIDLRDYHQPLSADPLVRGRHAALLSIAYKRLRQTVPLDEVDLGAFEKKEQSSYIEEYSQMRETHEKSRKNKEALVPVLEPEIATGLDMLGEKYRQAIKLHNVDGYSYPEVAEKLALPIGTVKCLVSRGLKLLKQKCLQSNEQGEMKPSAKQIVVKQYAHTLEDPYRKAIHLHYLENRTYPEIADILCVPLNTAKSHVHRGMKLLQQIDS